MTQQQPRSDKVPMPKIIVPQFAEMEERIEAMIDMQAEIFSTLAQINRDWFDRAKSEARVASELTAKLTAAHSVSDLTAAYQEWHSQRMRMIADDSRRFFSESQKFMAIGVRLLGNSNPSATS